jgi:hypothetical protein
MFRFTIRELVLLTVIVAISVAWCVDQDRIWRDRAALRDERKVFEGTVQHLQTIRLKRAEVVLAAADAQLASLLLTSKRHPGATLEIEIRRQESRVDVAKLDLELARAKEQILNRP